MDTLNAAGYEAYNVTSDNYDALEGELQTDFKDMGLDPNGSYIIVISGEDSENSSSANSRAVSLPEQDIIDDSGSSFLYYYDIYDRYYTLRYFTVTCTDGEVSSDADLLSNHGTSFVNQLANSSVSWGVTHSTFRENYGVLRTLMGLSSSATYSNGQLSLYGEATWTRKYVQVYDEQVSAWCSPFYTEYASTKFTFTGRYYNNTTYSYNSVSSSKNATIYGIYYNDTDALKELAVLSFHGINESHDVTGSLLVSFKFPSGDETATLLLIEN